MRQHMLDKQYPMSLWGQAKTYRRPWVVSEKQAFWEGAAKKGSKRKLKDAFYIRQHRNIRQMFDCSLIFIEMSEIASKTYKREILFCARMALKTGCFPDQKDIHKCLASWKCSSGVLYNACYIWVTLDSISALSNKSRHSIMGCWKGIKVNERVWHWRGKITGITGYKRRWAIIRWSICFGFRLRSNEKVLATRQKRPNKEPCRGRARPLGNQHNETLSPADVERPGRRITAFHLVIWIRMKKKKRQRRI